MATADKVVLELRADNDQYLRKLKQSETAFGGMVAKVQAGASAFTNAFKGGLAGIAAGLGLQAVIQLGKHLVDAAADTYTLAKAIGILPSELKALEDATMAAGGDVDSLDQSLKFLSKTVGEARSGGQSGKFFEALGIDISSSRNLTQIYADIVAKLDSLGNAQDKAAVSTRLFGRSLDGVNATAAQIRGALAGQDKGFNDVAEGAHTAAVAFAEAGDALATLFTPVAVAAAEAIVDVINRFNQEVQIINDAMKPGTPLGDFLGGFSHVDPSVQKSLDSLVAGADKAAAGVTPLGGTTLPKGLFDTPKTNPTNQFKEATVATHDLTAATQAYVDVAASGFADVVTGAESVREALSNILKQSASMLANSAFRTLFTALLGGGAGFTQGVNTSTAGGTSSTMSSGGFLSSLVGRLFGGFHASGGTIQRGSWGIVGENGPEVVIPGQGGARVRPIGGSGGGTGGIVLNSVVNAPGANGADLGRILDVRDRNLLAQLPGAIAKHQRNRRMM